MHLLAEVTAYRAHVEPEQPQSEALPWRRRRDRHAGGTLSPAVRRLVVERGVDTARLTGTGADGRITRNDVLAARPSIERVPFDRIRRRAADGLLRAKVTAAHAFAAVDCDYSAVERARRGVRDEWREREGFGLTALPFVARAVVDALGEFTRLNATVGDDALVMQDRVHLGIAVDLDHEGLLVPVVHDAEALRLVGLARAIFDCANRARRRELRPDDVTGGTFTITNPGAAGTHISVPIIHAPEVAILSTDGVRKEVVAIDGELSIRPIGRLCCSFDHRAVDGAYVGAFLDRVRTIVEQRDWSSEIW